MEEEPSDRCGGTNLKSPKVEAFQPKVYETMSPPMAHRRESQVWCSGVDGPLVGLFRKQSVLRWCIFATTELLMVCREVK